MLINNAVITGSFTVNGVDVAGITGSSAISSSFLALSSSYVITSASYAQSSASLSIRTGNLEATSSTLVSASSSFAAQSASFSSRVNIIEGQDATTGSNTFTGVQYISQASNAISFTSTASLYTDGGLRVAKDSFVSGTAYFNNIIVYGTSSIEYITSSQVDIGANIITVNTDTPAVRFGGLSVFDSGSTQLTGSMLWDSQTNHWVYSNPSGSSYSGGMIMSGPRSSALGSEQGTTNNALMKGQGGDHITSSQMIDDGTTVRIPGNLQVTGSLSGSSAVFSGTVIASNGLLMGNGGATATTNYIPKFTGASTIGNSAITDDGTTVTLISRALSGTSATFSGNVTLSSGGDNLTLARTGFTSWGVGVGTVAGINGLHIGAGASTYLSINQSSGATTFSSSVTAGGIINANSAASAANGSINIDNSDPTLRFRVSGGSANKRIYEWRAIAAGGTNDRVELRLWNDAESSASNLFNITSAGNVGIGTTSPSDFIDASLGMAIMSSSGRSGLTIGSTQGTANEVLGRLSFTNTNSTNAGSKRLAYISGIRGTTDNSAYLEFGTADNALGTQRMVIGQNGNVGIGTSTFPNFGANRISLNINASDGSGLVLKHNETVGCYIFSSGVSTDIVEARNLPMNFFTNGTERMRITSGGNVAIGNTIAAKPLSVWPSGGIGVYSNNTYSPTISLDFNSGTNIGHLLADQNAYYIRTLTSYPIYVQANAANGVYLSVGATSWTSNSDERLKNINGVIDNAVEKLQTLRTVKYSWKSDTTNKENLGLIAQDVEQVFPEVIDRGKVENNDDTDYLGVRYQELVPVLVKAIQELKAELDTAKTEINELKNK
jgi:hypothetical protein